MERETRGSGGGAGSAPDLGVDRAAANRQVPPNLASVHADAGRRTSGYSFLSLSPSAPSLSLSLSSSLSCSRTNPWRCIVCITWSGSGGREGGEEGEEEEALKAEGARRP